MSKAQIRRDGEALARVLSNVADHLSAQLESGGPEIVVVKEQRLRPSPVETYREIVRRLVGAVRPKEAAEMAGMGVRSMRDLENRGLFPPRRWNGVRWVYRVADIAAWQESLPTQIQDHEEAVGPVVARLSRAA